jgi:hypothetical protein
VALNGVPEDSRAGRNVTINVITALDEAKRNAEGVRGNLGGCQADDRSSDCL